MRHLRRIKKGNDMNKKEFCEQYTQFCGEEVDDIKQIDTILFDGGELLRLVNHMINHSSERQVDALVIIPFSQKSPPKSGVYIIWDEKLGYQEALFVSSTGEWKTTDRPYSDGYGYFRGNLHPTHYLKLPDKVEL